MRRINNILEETPEISNQTDNPFMGVIKGQVDLKRVTFHYPKEKVPALNTISLSIDAGKTAAIVGGVGSGKSTLLQILPRLIETERNMVQIDGIPIHDRDLNHLRASIGFVTQEAHIFSDTIVNNIIFGREGVSEDHMKRILEISQLSADINAFPEGIHSVLGERGITLSGGQRQRLTIARALIADPPILILDDALSQVDTRTEAAILQGILEMRQGKTNIIVSHRLSTIRRANIIFVLKDGQLAEQGVHTALLKAKNEYARLYRRQQLSEELESF